MDVLHPADESVGLLPSKRGGGASPTARTPGLGTMSHTTGAPAVPGPQRCGPHLVEWEDVDPLDTVIEVPRYLLVGHCNIIYLNNYLFVFINREHILKKLNY